MKAILKYTTLSAILLILLGGFASCKDKDKELFINGTWKVKALSISGELTNIDTLPNDANFPHISILIPKSTSGHVIGNTFYDMVEFEFNIKKDQQIHIYNYAQYVKNELIIWLEPGVNAAEFATANSHIGITPKENLSTGNLNIWLFETDGVKLLSEIINILSQNPDVRFVQRNHTGITPRDAEGMSFKENVDNTVRFDISNDELIFLNSHNIPVIIFTKH